MDGCGDSLDLVPIAAWFGKGKRKGAYGAYLLACYDYDDDQYQSVCKIGTGFSDEDLTTLAAAHKDAVIDVSQAYLKHGLATNVFSTDALLFSGLRGRRQRCTIALQTASSQTCGLNPRWCGKSSVRTCRSRLCTRYVTKQEDISARPCCCA